MFKFNLRIIYKSIPYIPKPIEKSVFHHVCQPCFSKEKHVLIFFFEIIKVCFTFPKRHFLRDRPRTWVSSSFWIILADFRFFLRGLYTKSWYNPDKKNRKIDRTQVRGRSLMPFLGLALNGSERIINMNFMETLWEISSLLSWGPYAWSASCQM